MIPFVFLFAREWLLTYKSYENRVSWTYNKALRSVQSFCFRGFVRYVFWWLKEVKEGGMRQGKGMKGDRNGGEEECMNYPYIISTLFVLVWVDGG